MTKIGTFQEASVFNNGFVKKQWNPRRLLDYIDKSELPRQYMASATQNTVLYAVKPSKIKALEELATF